MNYKKILVIGAGGFVGKHLVRYLTEHGYSVRAMVRSNSDPSFLKTMNVEIAEADLRIKDTIRPALEGVDCVIHLAATMKGPWEEYYESSVQGTRWLLEMAKNNSIKKFIYISSIAVHGIDDLKGKAITEESPYAKEPLSSYERSKIQAEEVVRKFAKNDFCCTIVRPAAIYGPGGSLHPSRLGYSFGENRFLVIGNGNNRIPLVYIDNLLDAIRLVIENQNVCGQTYNIIDDQTIAQRYYLESIKKEIKSSFGITCIPYAMVRGIGIMLDFCLKFIKKQSPLRKRYLVQCSRQINYSNEKAKIELGWEPGVKPKDAVLRMMAWHKKQIESPKEVDTRRLKGNIYLKKPVNVGIVGCGWISTTHLSTLKKIKNAKVVALCDPNKETAQKLAAQLKGARIYTDFDDMLKNEKMDVVHVLTPPQSHKELVIKAAQKGCHILVEKPMAMNAGEAQEMVEAAEKSGVKLCVNHNHMYDPIMIEARRLVHSGALGNIVSAESWYGFNLGANLSSRYMTPGAEKHWALNMPGRLYQNLLPHPLSILVDIIGYPDDICVMSSSASVVKAMKDDELRVIMKSKGKIGTISVSLAVNPRYQFLNIYGTKTSIFLDFLSNTLVKHVTPKMIPKAISRAFMNLSTARILTGATIRNFWKVLMRTFTPYEGTEILIKEFYKSLENEGIVPVSGREGLESMQIMDKVWERLKGKR